MPRSTGGGPPGQRQLDRAGDLLAASRRTWRRAAGTRRRRRPGRSPRPPRTAGGRAAGWRSRRSPGAAAHHRATGACPPRPAPTRCEARVAGGGSNTRSSGRLERRLHAHRQRGREVRERQVLGRPVDGRLRDHEAEPGTRRAIQVQAARPDVGMAAGAGHGGRGASASGPRAPRPRRASGSGPPARRRSRSRPGAPSGRARSGRGTWPCRPVSRRCTKPRTCRKLSSISSHGLRSRHWRSPTGRSLPATMRGWATRPGKLLSLLAGSSMPTSTSRSAASMPGARMSDSMRSRVPAMASSDRGVYRSSSWSGSSWSGIGHREASDEPVAGRRSRRRPWRPRCPPGRRARSGCRPSGSPGSARSDRSDATARPRRRPRCTPRRSPGRHSWRSGRRSPARSSRAATGRCVAARRVP